MNARPAILNIKFSIPNTSGTLNRQRLISILQKISKKKLTLITAGAGFGKTTVVAQALAASKMDTAWYSLDESDGDPALFLGALVATVRKRYPDVGKNLFPRLFMSSGSRRNRDSLLMEFLAEIESHALHDMVLVLDDYHLIQDSPEISEIIHYLLGRMPPVLHLAIISRTEPALNISRLHAMREIIDIGEDDLCFQPDEIEQLYRSIFHLELQNQTVHRLHATTGGWIAGLVLIQNSLKGKSPEDVSERIFEIRATKNRIHAYFDETIFRHQTDEIRAFMLDTSLLTRLDSDECDALFNRNNSREILDTLCRNHLLTFPCGDGGTFFQYHHLLRDFFRERLRKKYSKEEIRKQHLEIGIFMENQRDIPGALYHFLEGLYWDDVRRIIVNMVFTDIMSCPLSVLSDAIDRLPETMIAEDAGLLYVRARFASLKGEIRDAIAGFQRCLRRFQADDNRIGVANCMKDLGFHYYLTGDVNRALHRMKALQAATHPDPFFPVEVAGCLVLFSSILGKPEAADRYYDDAMISRSQWGKAEKPLFIAWMKLCYSNRFHCSGDFEKSHALNEAALTAFTELGLEPFLPLTHFQAALTSFYRSSSLKGLEHAEKGIALAIQVGIQDHQYAWLLYARALNRFGTSDLQAAFRDAETSLSIFKEHGNSWGQATVYELLGLVYRRIGKPDLAEIMFQTGLRVIDGLNLMVTQNALILRSAELLVDQGKWESAYQMLNLHEFDASEFNQFQRHLLTARIHTMQNNPEQAAAALGPALTLSWKNHYQEWLTQELSWAAPILLTCHQMGIMNEIIEQVFTQAGHRSKGILNAIKPGSDNRMRQTVEKLTSIVPNDAPDPLFICCLGPFEVRVGSRKIPPEKWQSLAATRLFKFLVLRIDKGFIPKDVLLEWLWPDTDPEITRNRFHVALSSLRKVLEPDLKRGMPSAYILRQKDAYRLEIENEGGIDFREFLTEVDRADRLSKQNEAEALNRYLTAESLYTGMLFEENPFEDGFTEDRERLKNRHLHLLSRIIRLYEQNGQWTDCIQYAEKYLTIDPCAEPVHCAILRCHACLGETSRVRWAFNRCHTILASELGCLPGPDVNKLYTRLIPH